jgi:hypothetical protein
LVVGQADFAIVAIDPRTGPVRPAAPPWFVPYCWAVGVGHTIRPLIGTFGQYEACAAIAGNGCPTPLVNFWFGPPFAPSLARIVAHKPVPVPKVVRTRARGLDRHDPHGVFQGFQITSHKSEPLRSGRNLFSKDRCRAALLDEPVPSGP